MHTAIQELVTRTTYDIRGNVLTITDALGREAFHNHVYDYANRNLRIDSIDAGLRKTLLDAAGGVIEQRDSKGALILHGYDNLNRPLRLWARDGASEKLTLLERLEYGDAGSPSQPASDRTTNRAANRLGKLSRYFDEAGLLTFEAYDFKGNLLEKTRRVVSDTAILEVFKGPPPAWKVEAFRVDWTNPAAVPLDATTFASTVSYDSLNRVKLMTYPEDVENRRRKLRPNYNRAGALERVAVERVAPGGGVVSDTFVERIAYNAKGQRVLIVYGNGIMTRHAYDPHTFRLLRLRTEHYNKPAELMYRHTGEPHQELAYEFDLVGNILKIQERTPGGGIKDSLQGQDALDREFSYDALYRLRSATSRECDRPPNIPWDDRPRCTDLTKTRSYIERYLYDAVGNIEQLKHLANGAGFNRDFEMVPGNNRLHTLTAGAAALGYEYDANGNMTRETTTRHFEWDFADHMRVYRTQTDASEPSVHAHYLYDAGGQRVKKLVRKQGGQIEVTVYIDSIFEYQRIVRVGTIEQNNTLHVMDNQSRIALVRVGTPFANDTTPSAKYQLSDYLGSSNVVVDRLGTLIDREEYTPYGDTSYGCFARKRYRFNGKEREEENGFYYHGARYQAPWLARWVSCDPLGSAIGINLYMIFNANPANRVDPTGLADIDVNAAARVDATGPTYKESWTTSETKGTLAEDTNTLSVNGETLKSPPKKSAQSSTAATPANASPSTGSPRPSIRELREERLNAALAGAANRATDSAAMVQIAMTPALFPLIAYAADKSKISPPVATGDTIRDLENSESYEGGGMVVDTIVVAASLSPLGEIAEAAALAARKLPAPAGGLGIAGQEFVGFSERWAALANERGMSIRNAFPKAPEHHVFPQQFRKWFEGRGISIDEYTAVLNQGEHEATHLFGWNPEWKAFIKANPNALEQEVFEFAGRQLDKYRISIDPKIVTYGRTR